MKRIKMFGSGHIDIEQCVKFLIKVVNRYLDL
jgi:hypothetical protein